MSLHVGCLTTCLRDSHQILTSTILTETKNKKIDAKTYRLRQEENYNLITEPSYDSKLYEPHDHVFMQPFFFGKLTYVNVFMQPITKIT
jgi:hypothetical protein